MPRRSAYWHGAKELIRKVSAEAGTDICASDNEYHIKIKTGKKSTTHKYSQSLVDLLKKVQKSQKYDLKLKGK